MTVKNTAISMTEASLKNRKLLAEESALYNIFLEPFVDVAKSVKLAGQDILNTMKLVFDTMITLSPRKLREAREKYKSRRDKIDREWEPLMKKASESISSDVKLAALVFAPQAVFAVQAARLGAAAPTTVVDYLEESGWEIPLLNVFSSGGGKSKSGKSFEERFEEWIEDQEDEKTERKKETDRNTLAGRLSVFFFGEAISHSHSGEVITEAESQENSPSSALLPKLEKFTKEVIEPLMQSAREEFIASKKAQAEDLAGPAAAVVRGIKAISVANDPAAFESAIQVLESDLKSRGDKETIDLKPIKDAIAEMKQRMEQAFEKVKSKQGPAPDGSKPEDVEAVAKKASQDAFEQSATALRKMASDALPKMIENYKESIAKELMLDIPTKGEFATAFADSSEGKEVIDIIKKAVDSIGQ